MQCRKRLISWKGGTDVRSTKVLGQVFEVSVFYEITWYFEWKRTNGKNSVAFATDAWPFSGKFHCLGPENRVFSILGKF